MKNSLAVAVSAAVLAMGMTGSSLLLSKLLVRIRHEQAITVKGYAERDVVSDFGKFSCTISARGTTLKDAYDALQQSRGRVLDYLGTAGFHTAEVASQTIETTRVMKRNAEGNETNEIEYYDVCQTITVCSTNVMMIQNTAVGITELLKEGISISAGAPSFYISDLKDLKLKLLAEATQDGFRRAKALAASSGGRVGALIAARQGVFQITQRHSTETSDYGVYDTSTVNKTVKAVVTLEYQVERRR